MWEIIQILISVLLTVAIVVQSRGTGLGSAWGGTGQSFHTKRGFERILFAATIALSVIFITSSLLNAIR